MKKILSLLVMALVAMSTVVEAQDREVRLPNRPNTRRNVQNFQPIGGMQQGFWCALEAEVGTSAMPQSRNMQDVGLQFIGGFRVSEMFRVGVGVGFRNYVNDPSVRYRDDAWAFPIFLNLRGNIVTQEVYHAVPFWSLSAGTVVRDGLMIQPKIGVRIGTDRNAFTVALGYRYQQMNTTYDKTVWDDPCYNKNDNVNGVSLTLGYEF